MLDLKIENTLHAGLGDADDLAVLDVLSEQHTEIGGSHRTGFIFPRKINKREGCGSGKGEPVLRSVIFYGEQQFIRFRLRNFEYPSSGQGVIQFFSYICNGYAVKCHRKSFLRENTAV